MKGGNIGPNTISGIFFEGVGGGWAGVIATVRNGEIGIMPVKLNFQRNGCSCRDRRILLIFLLF